MEGREPICHGHVDNDCDRPKNRSMLSEIMSELQFQYGKTLEPRIDSFMPRKESSFCNKLDLRHIRLVADANVYTFSFIAIVSFNHFMVSTSTSKFVYEGASEDDYVGPDTAWEWPMDPHNQACLNAHGHLIAQTWSVEFVGPPTLTEGPWLIDHEICTIHRDETDSAHVTFQTIFPPNLTHGKL